MALFCAAGVGLVIARNACLAGAQAAARPGGSAAAGPAPPQSCAAARRHGAGRGADAESMLGLVCDPVAGLVEIPCIKRNATATAIAFACAEMALAGVQSAIPADEVIVAMKRVGDSMPAALKETAEGGLAATPTAQALFEQVFGRAAQSAAGRRAARMPVRARTGQRHVSSAPRTQCAGPLCSAGLFFKPFCRQGPKNPVLSGMSGMSGPACAKMDAVNSPAEGKAARATRTAARAGPALAARRQALCRLCARCCSGTVCPFPARPARADRAGRPNAAPQKMAPLPRPGRKAPFAARAGKAPGAYCAAFSKGGNCTVMAVPTPTGTKAARQCPQRCVW
ncbi:MAG: L-serine ammonia-lyase, iron-sulfur-dependent, subunit alpha [Ruthenibacterium sp.]